MLKATSKELSNPIFFRNSEKTHFISYVRNMFWATSLYKYHDGVYTSKNMISCYSHQGCGSGPATDVLVIFSKRSDPDSVWTSRFKCPLKPVAYNVSYIIFVLSCIRMTKVFPLGRLSITEHFFYCQDVIILLKWRTFTCCRPPWARCSGQWGRAPRQDEDGARSKLFNDLFFSLYIMLNKLYIFILTYIPARRLAFKSLIS